MASQRLCLRVLALFLLSFALQGELSSFFLYFKLKEFFVHPLCMFLCWEGDSVKTWRLWNLCLFQVNRIFKKDYLNLQGEKKTKQNQIINLKWFLMIFTRKFFIKSAQHLSNLEAVKEPQLRSVVYSECGITRASSVRNHQPVPADAQICEKISLQICLRSAPGRGFMFKTSDQTMWGTKPPSDAKDVWTGSVQKLHEST